MNSRQSRWSKSAVGLLVWLVLIAFEKPSDSAEPPGILEFVKALKSDDKIFGSFVFAPDGKTVAGCGFGWLDDLSLPGSIRLWSVESGEKTLNLNIPGANVMSLAFGRDGRRLFSGSFDGAVRSHDLRSLKTEVIPGALGQVVAISPDGTHLAVTAGQSVQLIDLSSKKITATRHPEQALDIVPCPMAFGACGSVIAIARRDRLRVSVFEVELCDARHLNPIKVLRSDAPSAPAATALGYSPDGSLLATGADDGSIVVWDVNTLKQRGKANAFTDPKDDRIFEVVFSPDGKLLGVVGSEISMLLRVDTLAVVGKIGGPGAVGLAFSPDGKLLLTSEIDTMQQQETKLWKQETKLWKIGSH